MSEIILKDEYSNEEECKLAIAKYNEGKKPEEEMRYCSYFHSIKRKRMYVPCTIEYFYAWRNMLAEEHRQRDLETRCLVPSERYNYYKKCKADCSNCPYGKDHRDGGALSLDKFYEEYEYEFTDTHVSVVDEMIADERNAELQYQISLLDEESRKLLSLFNAGYSEPEIGRALGISRDAVKYRKKVILERLKKSLENF